MPTQSARTQFIRPLTKGMVLDNPANLISDGAFRNLKNWYSDRFGIFRRPGYEPFLPTESTPYQLVDFITAWVTDGGQENILLTNRVLYTVTATTGFTEIAWGFSGTGMDVVETSPNLYDLTDAAATFLSEDLMVGDLIRIGSQEAEIVAILSDTVLAVRGLLTEGTGYDYTVQRAFGSGYTEVPDWVIHEGYLLIADGKRDIIQYNIGIGTIGYWMDDPAYFPSGTTRMTCGCLASFKDRLWAGYIEDDADGRKRQRIRWSSLANSRNFNISSNYLDLPYTKGALRRLVPQGGSLIAYFDDMIYAGTPTNYPLLPYRFDAIESGGIGLVGMRGVTSFLNGHFFIGQNDIYFLSSGRLARIGSTIAQESILKCEVLTRCIATVDPRTNTALFGIPYQNDRTEYVWRYNYETKAWSYEDIQTTMLANPVLSLNLGWGDLTGTWDDLGSLYADWDSMQYDDQRAFIYIERNQSLARQTVDGRYDNATEPIPAEILTKEHDFETPDSLKIFTRFGLHLAKNQSLVNPIRFLVSVSVNSGQTWKNVGELVIPPNTAEGYINFRALGSSCRFKLTTSSETLSYYVTEYTIRARYAGEELDVSTQA